MSLIRDAFSKWTDEYLLRLWGKRRVIDVEIKKVCATNLACFFACFRCTECIESIYACTFSGVGARFEQVEERGGPSVQWPFEKFVKEMHKAILNDCDESRLVFGVEVVTTAFLFVAGREER